jgi:hypothetical protein
MDRKTLVEQVLVPVVRVRAAKARGSATVVHSSSAGTYLITNHHVVDDNISYKEVWDELLKRNVKKEFTSLVEVDFSRIDDCGVVSGVNSCYAEVVISNKERDMALLRLVKDQAVYRTAIFYPEALCEKVPILTELACAGAALGEKPIVTLGLLNGVQIEIDNYEYYMTSAQSIFGNSGGAVFAQHEDVWKYMGIPSRIPVIPIGFGGNAVTHMGLFIPVARIYGWLRDNCYEFLWDESTTKGACDLAREKKREKELSMAMAEDRK